MAFDRAAYWREYRARNATKQSLKRTPLKKKWAKIKPVSKKMMKQKTIYSRLRKDFLEEHPYCEARIPGCWIEAAEIHHKAGRSGEALIDTENFLAVCRSCHEYIEGHPLEAKKRGFSKNRL
jgi:hypothetical protein